MSRGARKVLVFQNRFLIGGQERQTVLHLRTIDRSAWEPVVACLHREGEYLVDLAAMGIAPRLVDVGSSLMRPNTLLQVARLAETIRRERIALVHAQDIYTDVLGVLAARLARVPAIVTRVDLGHATVGLRKVAVRWASRTADRVLVNARAIEDLCVAEGVDPSRIAVVRNGIDLDAFDRAAREEPLMPAPQPGSPAVVNVANMHHPVKAQSDLLRALPAVRRRIPGVKVIFVGNGVRRPLLEREASELGIRDACLFAGFRADVPALLARATACVSASHAEGISNAILEAMAARLPVVATAVGGSPELVRDGLNGFLVPPGSPERLAERLVAVLEDRARGRRMGEEGRRIAEREFGLAAMRRAYDALYRGVLGDRAEPLAKVG